MNEFEALEKLARDKRRATIAKARQEFRATLAQIRALKKAIVGNPAHQPNGCQVDTQTLRQAILVVLGTRKMTLTELVVGILETGYKTTSTKREFRKTVAKILRKDGRFKRDGARWTG
jgi:hypothetical protein